LTNNFQLMMLRTNIPEHIRRPISEEVVSVIHAPPSFQNWVWSILYLPWCEHHVDSIFARSQTMRPPSLLRRATPAWTA
jgi:hypothetical protein